jgi:hypothetical protein
MARLLHLTLALAATLGVLSGCLAKAPKALGPCDEGYYVGCDHNVDAALMLQRFGLHQVTNYTINVQVEDQRDAPGNPQIGNGTILWHEGGYHKPHEVFTTKIATNRRIQLPTRKDPYMEGILLFPNGCCVLYSLTHHVGDYFDDANATLWKLNLDSGIQTRLPRPNIGPLGPGGVGGVAGFDGDWLLVAQFHPLAPNQTTMSPWDEGMGALNLHTGAYRELVRPILRPMSQYYGERLGWNAVGNHTAFYDITDGGQGSIHTILVATNLDTGTNRTLLETNSVIEEYDANSHYLVVPTVIQTALGSRGLWVMSQTNGTWWNIEKDPTAIFVEPRLGGDWCIFEERRGNPPTTELVGVYLPTGKKYDLIPSDHDMSMIHWATDGKRVVVNLQLESWNPWAKYPGIQIYWMDLPIVT